MGRAASSFRRKELLIGSSNRKDTRRPAKHLGLPNPVVCLRIPGQPGLRVGDILVPCPIQVEGGNDVDSSQPLSGPRVSAGSGWERNSFGRSQGLLMILKHFALAEAFCFGRGAASDISRGFTCLRCLDILGYFIGLFWMKSSSTNFEIKQFRIQPMGDSSYGFLTREVLSVPSNGLLCLLQFALLSHAFNLTPSTRISP